MCDSISSLLCLFVKASELSNLFNLVLMRKLGSPPSPCSDVAETRPFLITRKSKAPKSSESQGSDPAIKGLPKKSSPVVPACDCKDFPLHPIWSFHLTLES